MTKFLITGANGFVGSNLVRRLYKKNNEIYIIVKKESKLWRLNDLMNDLNIFFSNMLSIEKLKEIISKTKPNIVYHLATYGAYPHQKDFHTLIQTNIINSVNIMMALQSYNKLEKFVNIGSSSEYGKTTAQMSEKNLPNPQTEYGITKLSQTFFAKLFNERYNLPTITLRLFSVYGPYEGHGRLITDLMMALVNKTVLHLSYPRASRDFIHVNDVVDALEISGKSSMVGEIFNIGSGIERSIKEVIKLVLTEIDSSLQISWGHQEKKRDFETYTKWVADITKSKKMLCWKPKTSLSEGLKKTHSWFCKNSYLYEKYYRS